MGTAKGTEEAQPIKKGSAVIDLKLRDQPSATRELRAAVDRVADECSLGEDERFDLKVAATEALTNALKAGPAGDEVEVTIACENRSVEIEVTTVGEFTPRIRVEGDRDLEGGRGIPLMVALVDEVVFVRTGRGVRVRMRKGVASAGEGDSALGTGDSVYG